jgi:hypothetical protein
MKKDKPKRKYTKKVKGPVLTNTTVVKETALAPIPRGSLVSVDPQALIAQAIDKGLPLESMERLLAMRRELKAEWAKEQYFEALARFQAACPNIIKDKDVLDRDGKFRYSYAPLDVIVTAVKGALDANGFSYTIQTKQDEKAVTSECHAHHTAGHSEISAFTIPMDPKAYMNESQKIASAMTYAKRYAFCNAFGIMTSDQDDDSNSTTEPVKGPQRKVKNDDPIPVEAEVSILKAAAALDAEILDAEKIVGSVPDAQLFQAIVKKCNESKDMPTEKKVKAMADARNSKMDPDVMRRILASL